MLEPGGMRRAEVISLTVGSINGLGQMLERRSAQAGIPRIHPHQLRHTAADIWLSESGGDETSAMRLFGWRSRQMLQRYAASNADARAHAAARKLGIGDRL
jgi:integrase